MEALNQWFKEMSELENEKTEAFMKERMGPLLRIALIMPDYNYPWRYLIALFIVCSITFMQCVLMFYSVILLWDDFDNFIITLHISLLYMFCLVLVFHFNLIRRPLCTSMQIATNGFYDYGEEPHKDIPKIVEEAKKDLYAVALLPIFICLSVGLLIISPIIDEYRGVRSDAPYNENGVNLKITIPTWYPFPAHEGVPFFICEGLQAATILFVGIVFGTGDILYFIGSNELVIQLHTLRLSLKTIDRRAKKLFLKRHHRHPTLNDQIKLQECLDYCLGQNVAHHKSLVSYLEGYNYIAGLPVAGAFVVGTIVIALSMISLAEESEHFKVQNTAFFCTVVAESLNMFLLSFYGQKLGTLSEDVFYEIYCVDWTKYHKRFKTSMMIFQEGTRKPWVLRALGLVDCNMETFSGVMNTAYSYFNLLSASKALENKK